MSCVLVKVHYIKMKFQVNKNLYQTRIVTL